MRFHRPLVTLSRLRRYASVLSPTLSGHIRLCARQESYTRRRQPVVPSRSPATRKPGGRACRLHMGRLHRLDVRVLNQSRLLSEVEDLAEARPGVDRPQI